MAQSAISRLNVRKQLHGLIARKELVFAVSCGLSKGVGRGRSSDVRGSESIALDVGSECTALAVQDVGAVGTGSLIY
jgi:hypothetical protein